MGLAYIKLASMAADSDERLWILRPKLHVSCRQLGAYRQQILLTAYSIKVSARAISGDARTMPFRDGRWYLACNYCNEPATPIPSCARSGINPKYYHTFRDESYMGTVKGPEMLFVTCRFQPVLFRTHLFRSRQGLEFRVWGFRF